MTHSTHAAALCLLAVGLALPPGGPAHAQSLAQTQAPAPNPAPAPDRPEPRGEDFYIFNATNLAITVIQASRTDEDTWGPNRLGSTTLAPGARFLVHLPDDGRCKYDLRYTFSGGNVLERRGVDACKAAELRVAETGAPPAPRQSGSGTTAPPATPETVRVTFVNNFRRPLTELKVSPSASTQWGEDRLGQATIAPQGRWDLTLPASAGCQYDLHATFDGASPQEMSNVNLCTAGTVTFDGPRPGTIYAYGTGFRVSAAGHIMTNNHVVQGCGSVAILAKDRRLPLRVVGQDAVVDLAMLQQPDMVTPFLSFRDRASPVRLAERAISIGYPIPSRLGERVVTEGIVNALTGGRGDATQYQLQTPIQPGNSGGPIFDGHGLVIGIAVSGIERAGDRIIQNVNFAISPVIAERFAASLDVPLHYEPGTQELSTADVMDRNADRVVQLVCLN